MRIGITTLAAMSAFALGQSTRKSEWVVKKESNVMTSCTTKVKGVCNGQEFDAEIQIRHIAGHNETFNFNIIIPAVSKYQFLNLDQFDPWEPNSKKKVLTVKPKDAKSGYRTYAEGRSPDADTFMFDNTTSNLRTDSLYKMLIEAKTSDSDWVALVADKSGKNTIMSFQFSFTGARAFLMNCSHK